MAWFAHQFNSMQADGTEEEEEEVEWAEVENIMDGWKILGLFMSGHSSC